MLLTDDSVTPTDSSTKSEPEIEPGRRSTICQVDTPPLSGPFKRAGLHKCRASTDERLLG